MQSNLTIYDSCSYFSSVLTIFSNVTEKVALYTNQTTVRIGKIKVTVVTKLIIC